MNVNFDPFSTGDAEKDSMPFAASIFALCWLESLACKSNICAIQKTSPCQHRLQPPRRSGGEVVVLLDLGLAHARKELCQKQSDEV